MLGLLEMVLWGTRYEFPSSFDFVYVASGLDIKVRTQFQHCALVENSIMTGKLRIDTVWSISMENGSK